MQRASGGPVRADRGGVGYLLNQAARGVRAKLAEELRLQGLDDRDFILMRNVITGAQRGEDVLTSDISQSLNIDFSHVNETARKLARNGWIELEESSGALQLKPTPKAAAVMPGMQDTAHWTLEHALNGFSHDEIEQLTGYLARIVHNTGDSG